MSTESPSHLLIETAFKRPAHRRPVWLMRQAGRYLPEYQAVRQTHGFLEMCQTPSLAVEISLQPWRRFRPDGVIVFSDILFVPAAMGQTLTFSPGPRLEPALRSTAQIDALPVPDPAQGTPHILAALETLRRELADEVPVLGFCGAPWTLATYMVEGEHARHLQHVKGLRYSDPQALHRLLDRVTDALVLYCRAQMDAGAQFVQVFDSFAGELTPADYAEFAAPYTARLIAEIRRDEVPLVLFAKGSAGLLEAMAGTGADVLSVDWSLDLLEAKARVGDRVALQGNFDPTMMLAPPARIEDMVTRQLAAYGSDHGWIGNLGHGVLPFFDPAHVETFVRVFKENSRGYASGGQAEA